MISPAGSLRTMIKKGVRITTTSIHPVEGHALEVADISLAKNIAETLHAKYPGHLWAVNVNSEGGVVDIKNFRISSRYGIRLLLNTLTPFDRTAMSLIVNSGGEMLERAKMPRGRATGELATDVEGIPNRHREIWN